MLASTLEVAQGVSEYDWVGGIRGEPYPVVKAPVTGLPIPATAEIVLEGYMHRDKLLPEGPFGEWHGLLRHRPEGRAGDRGRGDLPPQRPDHHGHAARTSRRGSRMRYRVYLRSALLLRNMKAAGVPGRRGAYVPRVRRQPAVHRRVDQAALRRPCPPGDAHRRDVPCGRVHGPDRHRGRRRHRRHGPPGGHVGRRHPWRPGALDRHHQARLVRPDRPGHPPRREGHELPPALSTHAGPGSGATSSRRRSAPTPRRSARRAAKWGWVLDPSATPPAG